MTDEQLRARAQEIRQASRKIKHPLIPDAALKTIQGAADLVAELVKRETERNGKG